MIFLELHSSSKSTFHTLASICQLGWLWVFEDGKKSSYGCDIRSSSVCHHCVQFLPLLHSLPLHPHLHPKNYD
jgi:hypothetical protein